MQRSISPKELPSLFVTGEERMDGDEEAYNFLERMQTAGQGIQKGTPQYKIWKNMIARYIIFHTNLHADNLITIASSDLFDREDVKSALKCAEEDYYFKKAARKCFKHGVLPVLLCSNVNYGFNDDTKLVVELFDAEIGLNSVCIQCTDEPRLDIGQYHMRRWFIWHVLEFVDKVKW